MTRTAIQLGKTTEEEVMEMKRTLEEQTYMDYLNKLAPKERQVHEFTTTPLWHIETLLHLSKIHVEQGRLEDARKMVDWVKRLAEMLKSDAGLAMALQAEAGLLSATGETKEAETVYLKCLRLWEKAGWPHYHAKALVAYSEAIAQTNQAESKKRLREAAGTFRKLGAKRDLEKLEAGLSV